MSFFVGVIIKESGVKPFVEFMEGTFLYGSTFFLGLHLGLLCEANTIVNPKVWLLLILGSFALLVSGFGGIIGGYVVYFLTKGKFNPAVGIAGVSCVPTTAKWPRKGCGWQTNMPSSCPMPWGPMCRGSSLQP
jgi:oxaloacetate decarboxylase beta subunit